MAVVRMPRLAARSATPRCRLSVRGEAVAIASTFARPLAVSITRPRPTQAGAAGVGLDLAGEEVDGEGFARVAILGTMTMSSRSPPTASRAIRSL
jgi:hypothetical protein